jgi:hypothetical protein
MTTYSTSILQQQNYPNLLDSSQLLDDLPDNDTTRFLRSCLVVGEEVAQPSLVEGEPTLDTTKSSGGSNSVALIPSICCPGLKPSSPMFIPIGRGKFELTPQTATSPVCGPRISFDALRYAASLEHDDTEWWSDDDVCLWYYTRPAPFTPDEITRIESEQYAGALGIAMREIADEPIFIDRVMEDVDLGIDTADLIIRDIRQAAKVESFIGVSDIMESILNYIKRTKNYLDIDRSFAEANIILDLAKEIAAGESAVDKG